jgi:hypothetical protein
MQYEGRIRNMKREFITYGVEVQVSCSVDTQEATQDI